MAALCALADSPSRLRGIAPSAATRPTACGAHRLTRLGSTSPSARTGEPAARPRSTAGLPHLRRPPDGARRRILGAAWTGCCRGRRDHVEDLHRLRTVLVGPAGRGARAVSGRYGEHDQSTTAATRRPAAHQGAADVRRRRGRVRRHGRPGALHAQPGRPHCDRDEVAPPRPQGRHRRGPGPRGRRHLGADGSLARIVEVADARRCCAERPMTTTPSSGSSSPTPASPSWSPRWPTPSRVPASSTGPWSPRSTPGCSRCCA